MFLRGEKLTITRPAFSGDDPINWAGALNQQKRWSIGLPEVGVSKDSPATFGVRFKGIFMGHTASILGH